MNHKSLRQITKQVDGKGDVHLVEKATERGLPERNFTGMDAGRQEETELVERRRRRK
jgi:hypothetical protein